jgi:hypothetical protein
MACSVAVLLQQVLSQMPPSCARMPMIQSTQCAQGHPWLREASAPHLVSALVVARDHLVQNAVAAEGAAAGAGGERREGRASGPGGERSDVGVGPRAGLANPRTLQIRGCRLSRIVANGSRSGEVATMRGRGIAHLAAQLRPQDHQGTSRLSHTSRLQPRSQPTNTSRRAQALGLPGLTHVLHHPPALPMKRLHHGAELAQPAARQSARRVHSLRAQGQLPPAPGTCFAVRQAALEYVRWAKSGLMWVGRDCVPGDAIWVGGERALRHTVVHRVVAARVRTSRACH